MTTLASAARTRFPNIWLLLGIGLIVYAVLGNWLVLPGYRRFLEHGSPNAGTDGIDWALIWGATRTVLWFFSFHLGALCLAYFALLAGGDRFRAFRRYFVAGAVLWLAVWAIPALPGPFTWLFATLGIVIAAVIVNVFRQIGRDSGQAENLPTGAVEWRVASYFFFALATWDICGLGSVGGILHPDDQVRAASQTLVVTQTTKLIVELAIAWGLLALSFRQSHSPR